MNVPELAILIVSWNVRELLRRCLLSCRRSLQLGQLSARMVVVDNASGDGTADMLRSEFPEVELLEPGSNLGFAAGNNVGLRMLLGGPTPPEAILLLNPDTEVLADALPQLLRYLQAHPELVVLGPQLRYPDGSLQSSRRRLPTRLTYFWEGTLLERIWPRNPWLLRYHYADQPAEQLQQVDWLVGAALLVRSTAIRRAGLFDERFFMYSEELEWQSRLGHWGRIVYLPTAQIVHYEGRSSEQQLAHRHLFFQRSKLYLARRRHGRLFALILQLFLLVGYGWELLSEAGKWLLGHRRDVRRQRIGVYWQVLRSGLAK